MTTEEIDDGAIARLETAVPSLRWVIKQYRVIAECEGCEHRREEMKKFLRRFLPELEQEDVPFNQRKR